MKAVRTLPHGYAERARLDLSRQQGVVLGLAIGSLVLFVAGSWLLLLVMPLLRPGLTGFTLTIDDLPQLLLLFVSGLALIALMAVLHEAIHGLAFWAITRDWPTFGIRGVYAYAAAPGWYLPRGQHVAVALAPLVVITLIGLLLIAAVPVALVPAVIVVVTTNIGGAAGDLLVVGWLLGLPADALVNDTGDAIAVYQARGDAHPEEREGQAEREVGSDR